ncbi:regulator of DNA class I crossover intermediates 1-like [Amphiura filiformis]|uniref:regulator of DNA class I crossover intermediates 1-like n=1 Tax=Amphiura filiformis TaxID=82378 RepID=UPI003B20E010
MNWVGGARSRIKMKDELTKQKEYFEKKRYQNKVSRLEKPASPSKKRKLSLSTDLLSLQAASFSAKKFSTKDSSRPISQKKVTKVDLDHSRSSLLPFRRLDDVELPMSPGAPSKLLLQEANSGMNEEAVSSRKKFEPQSSFLMTQKVQSVQCSAAPGFFFLEGEGVKSEGENQTIFPKIVWNFL